MPKKIALILVAMLMMSCKLFSPVRITTGRPVVSGSGMVPTDSRRLAPPVMQAGLSQTPGSGFHPAVATIEATAEPTERPAPAILTEIAAGPANLPPLAMFTPVATLVPYDVQLGDSLLAISLLFGCSPEAIKDANTLDDENELYPGQRLMIPAVFTPTPTEFMPPTETPTLEVLPTWTSTNIPPTPSQTLIISPTWTQVVFSTSMPRSTGTPRPTSTPGPTSTSTGASGAVLGADCSCSNDEYNCGSFTSQVNAQACYQHCKGLGAGDIHELDGDDDGQACNGYQY